MCYSCTLCNRCGRADELKDRLGRRLCPSCGAEAPDNEARTCGACGGVLPPPFPAPPGSRPPKPETIRL